MQFKPPSTPEIIDILTEGGVKPSAQRMMILRYLMENRTHPTVDEIFKALQPASPTLSRTTVYNTLRLLTAAGIINCIGNTGCGDGARWDYPYYPHSHFLCTECGHVADVDFRLAPEPLAEMLLHYEVRSAEVIVKGLCPRCASAG